MCYRVRQEQAEPERAGATPPQRPSTLERLRARVIGAVAAALVAGLAAAALLMPSSTPAVSAAKASAAPAPVAAGAESTVPVAGVVEQTSTAMDDGVPTSSSSEVAKSARGHCDHEL